MTAAMFFAFLWLLIMCSSMPAFAASKKSKAVKAYRAYLETQGEGAHFDLIYLNSDSVPELVVDQDIYTYKSGKMVKMDPSISMYWPGSYYKKKGLIVYGYAHGGYYPSQFQRYMKMSGKKLVFKLEIGKFGETSFTTGKVKWTTSYSVQTSGSNGKKVKKAAFNKALKKLVGSKKPAKIRSLENTQENRSKYLK